MKERQRDVVREGGRGDETSTEEVQGKRGREISYQAGKERDRKVCLWLGGQGQKRF